MPPQSAALKPVHRRSNGPRTRAEIVAVAERHFAERGFEATRLDDIATSHRKERQLVDAVRSVLAQERPTALVRDIVENGGASEQPWKSARVIDLPRR